MKKAIKQKELSSPRIQVKKLDFKEKKLSDINWQEEIDCLARKKFNSFEDAVDELISLVLKRLKFSTDDIDLKNQLRLLLGTDPYAMKLLDPKHKKV